ncbi:MFS transporter [Pectobacterium betavasculorum]|uniref:MFS transporter n=1 Tax=Pectobacterium betavasculorum TaxID=55207 RepID=UPI00313DDDA3
MKNSPIHTTSSVTEYDLSSATPPAQTVLPRTLVLLFACASALSVANVYYAQPLLSMLSLLRKERVLQIRGVIALLMFAALSIFWSALVLPLSREPYFFSHTVIGAFGLVGILGALAAVKAGSLADKGREQWVSGIALLLLLVSWLPLWLAPYSLFALVVGIIVLDLGGQAIHVTNQSMIFKTHPDAHSRLVGCYMLFYSIGSGLGAMATTVAYDAAGWSGVCLLGAAVSLLALFFWKMTLSTA